MIDESPRCVARDYCCTAVQKCGLNEGYCTKNEQCQSNVCGPSGSCNTEMCSKNTGTCFSNHGRCCIKGNTTMLPGMCKNRIEKDRIILKIPSLNM